MNKKSVITLIILILNGTSLIVHFSSAGLNTLEESSINNDSSFFLLQNIIYTFNSTGTEQIFNVHVPNVKLMSFNYMTVIFKTTGDKSDSDGLEVSFSFLEKNLTFHLPRLFQNSGEYNLTEVFDFSFTFDGPLDLTILCKGKSSMGQTGVLTILDSSFIKEIEPPMVFESPSFYPVYSTWLLIDDSPFSTVTESVKTVIVHANESFSLNFTLFFHSSDFSAYSSDINVRVNGSLLASEEFNSGFNQIVFSSLLLKRGINLISFDFSVYMGMDIIEICDIELLGYAYCLENQLPRDIYEYVHWKNDLDYAFDLSSLKPSRLETLQELSVEIYYGCLGQKIDEGITYELLSGPLAIETGTLSSERQNPVNPLIHIKDISPYYDKDLTLRIRGRKNGEGLFFLLNSTKVDAETIPIINGSEYSETIVENCTIKINETGVAEIQFKEFIDLGYSYENMKLTVSFFIETATMTPIDRIEVSVNLGFSTIIQSNQDDLTYFNDSGFFLASSNIQQISFYLKIHSSNENVRLSDFTFKIQNYDYQISEPISEEDKNSIRRITITYIGVIGIIAIELFSLVTLFLQIFKRKSLKLWKRIVNRSSELIQYYSADKKRILQLPYVICIVTLFTFLFNKAFNILFPSIPTFAKHIFSFHLSFIVLAIVDGLLYKALNWRNKKLKKSNRSLKSSNNEKLLSRIIDKLNSIKKQGITYTTTALIAVYLISLTSLVEPIVLSVSDTYNGVQWCFGCGFPNLVSFYLSIISSIIVCFFMIKLVNNFVFIEDNTIKVLIVGGITLIWQTISGFILFSQIKINLSETQNTYFQYFLPLFVWVSFLLIYVLSLLLAKAKVEKLGHTFSDLLRTGAFKTNKMEARKAITQNLHSRLEYDLSSESKNQQNLGEESLQLDKNDSFLKESKQKISRTLEFDTEAKLEKIVDLEENESESFGRKKPNQSESLNLLDVIRCDINSLSEGGSALKGHGFNLPFSEDLLSDTSLVSIDKKRLIFKINPYLKKIIKSIRKNGLITLNRKVSISEFKLDDEDNLTFQPRKISLREIFNVTSSKRKTIVIASFMISELLRKLNVTINILNKYISDILRISDFNQENLSNESIFAYMRGLAQQALVDILEFKGSDVEKLITGVKISDQVKNQLKQILDSEELTTSNIERGEYAVIFWFLRNILFFMHLETLRRKGIPKERADQYWNMIIGFFEEKWKYRHIYSEEHNIDSYVLTDFYEPFMKYILSHKLNSDQKSTLDIRGLKLILPQETLYTNNIFNYGLEHQKEILKKGKYKYSKSAKKKNRIKEESSRVYDSIITKEIVKINQGKDFFRKGDFVLMQVVEGGFKNDFIIPLFNVDKEADHIRNGIFEIESKSGWFESPHACGKREYSINSKVGGQMTEEQLKTLVELFLNNLFYLKLKQGSKVKLQKPTDIQNMKNASKSVLNLIKKSPFRVASYWLTDRISPSSIRMETKHIMRKLLDLYSGILNQQEFTLLFDNYLLDSTVKKREENFYNFLEAAISGATSFILGKTKIPIPNEARQIVSDASSFVLANSLKTLSTGHPILQLVESKLINFVGRGVYLPSTFQSTAKKPRIVSPASIVSSTTSRTSYVYQMPIGIRLPSGNFMIHELSHESFFNIIDLQYDFDSSHFNKILAPTFIDLDGDKYVIVLDSSDSDVYRKEIVAKNNIRKKGTFLRKQSEYVLGAVVNKQSSQAISTSRMMVLSEQLVKLFLFGGRNFVNPSFENNGHIIINPLADLFNPNYSDCRIPETICSPPLIMFALLSSRKEALSQANAILYPLEHIDESIDYSKMEKRRYPADDITICTFSFLISGLPQSIVFYQEAKNTPTDDVWLYKKNQHNFGRYLDVQHATNIYIAVLINSLINTTRGFGGKQPRIEFSRWVLVEYLDGKNLTISKSEGNYMIREVQPKEYIPGKRWIKIAFGIPTVFNSLTSYKYNPYKPKSIGLMQLQACLSSLKRPFYDTRKGREIPAERRAIWKLMFSELMNLTIKIIEELVKKEKMNDYIPNLEEYNQFKNIVENSKNYSLIKLENSKYSILKPTAIARILLILFPEIKEIPNLPIISKGHLHEVYQNPEKIIKQLNSKNSRSLINAVDLVLTPFASLHPSQIIIHLFSATFLNSWTVTYEMASGRIESLYSVYENHYPVIKPILTEFLKVIMPFILFRSHLLSEYFETGDFQIKRSYLTSLNSEKFHKNLQSISSFNYSDIFKGKDDNNTITIFQRWLWIFVKLSEVTDSLTYGTGNWVHLMNQFRALAHIDDLWTSTAKIIEFGINNKHSKTSKKHSGFITLFEILENING